MQSLTDFVLRAQAGDVEAYGRLVQATQKMVYAVALSVLRDPTIAQDAAQQAYLSVGYGLERLAMLRYGIDDIRRIEVPSVA